MVPLGYTSLASTAISVVSVIIATGSAMVTYLIWKANKQSIRQSMYSSYRHSNRKTWAELDYDVVGPLTPYNPDVDKETLMIRQNLLERFNRFRLLPDEKERHIYYRKSVMGDSIEEFYGHVRENGGDRVLARKAVYALKEIRQEEPYFSYGNPSFWDEYFAGYDWSWEPPSPYEESNKDKQSGHDMNSPITE